MKMKLLQGHGRQNLSDNYQAAWGAAISYALIILNATYSLLLTPFIVGTLGDAVYGVYKTITAFSASLMVIDLGLGSTVQRFIAKYIAIREEKSKISNYVAMMLIEATALAMLALALVIAFYFNLDTIYRNGLSGQEIQEARRMFLVLGGTIALHMYENVLGGIVTGYGCFFFGNGCKLVRIILRMLFTYIGLSICSDAMVLVVLDLVLVVFLIVAEGVYIVGYLNLRPHLYRFDKSLFSESIVYSLQMFVSAVVNQVNSNLDSVFIGALLSSTHVAVYSVSVVFFGMFEQVASSISSVLLPKVTKLIASGEAHLQGFVVAIGRAQFMLIGAIFGGFCVLGKQFIEIWVGKQYYDAYFISLILMLPAIFELCVNACLAIIRAKNLMSYRTKVLILMLIINLFLTVAGIHFFGYVAAAIATAISYIIGHIILMNRYYRKVLGFNMIDIYKQIFDGIALCVLIASVATTALIKLFESTIYQLITGIITFLTIYVVSMLGIGINNSEKKFLQKVLKRKGRGV